MRDNSFENIDPDQCRYCVNIITISLVILFLVYLYACVNQVVVL